MRYKNRFAKHRSHVSGKRFLHSKMDKRQMEKLAAKDEREDRR